MVMDRGGAGGGNQLGIGSVRVAVAQIGLDGVMDQVRFLRDDPDGLAQRFKLDLLHVEPVYQHLPGVGVVQSGDQRSQRRLAGPGMADQGDKLAGLRVKRDAVQGRLHLRLVVAERHIRERHFAAHLIGRKRQSSGRVHNLLFEVQVLKDAVEQRQGARDIHLHVQETRQRKEQPSLQHGERDNRAE